MALLFCSSCALGRSWFPTAADDAAAARASLQLRPFTLGEVHDQEGAPLALRWPSGEAEGELVSSYPDPTRFEGGPAGFARLAGRSFLYDDALLALDRIRRGDRDGARKVLAALAALQLDDGAWGFSVDPDDGFYDAGFVRSGTVAFITYAFARYVRRFGELEPWVLEAARRGGTWLLAQRSADTGLLGAGSGFWSPGGTNFQASEPLDFVATEHQLDAFFALAALGRVDLEGGWEAEARTLAASIDRHLWLEEEGRFAQGWQSGAVDRRSALDASGSWGALFLLARGEEERAARALAWVDRMHRAAGPGWSGFKPYAEGPTLWFVEGSVAVALAWHRLGAATSATRHSAGGAEEARGADAEGAGGAGALPDAEAACARGGRELRELGALGRARGWPLIYSTAWEPDFPLTPAAGPTLWYLLVEEELRSVDGPFLWSETAAEREHGMASCEGSY